MIHQAPSKAQCVVQRVHSTSPQQRSEYGSGSSLPMRLLVVTVVLLLAMSCMILQVHTTVSAADGDVPSMSDVLIRKVLSVSVLQCS